MRAALCHPDRKHYAFGQCSPCYQRDNRQRFPTSRAGDVRKSRYYKPEVKRATDLLKKFGMTVEDYDRALAAQGGKCAICRGQPGGRWHRFCVDHDHKTGRVRGLLCLKCNRAVGLLGDDSTRAIALARYLDPDAKMWQTRNAPQSSERV